MIKISELYYYPIKSCAGWKVNSAELTATGFAHDREFVIATPAGRFMTQREFPRMALIQPHITDSTLTLSAPTMQPLSLPIIQQGDPQAVTVWRSTVQAIDQGNGAAQWLSQFLQAELRLFTMQAGVERKINPAFAQGSNDIVSFADGYSILVIAQASLDNLNSKLAEPMPMTRFRPNIVVTGCDHHAPDRWRHITIGNIPMTGAKPCARCAVTTVDPSTGIKGKEPLTTLATYRKFPNGVMFGMNLIQHKLGTLTVGDAIRINMLHDADWVGQKDLAATWE